MTSSGPHLGISSASARLTAQPRAVELLERWWSDGQTQESLATDQFLTQVASDLRSVLGASWVGIVQARGGQWLTRAAAGGGSGSSSSTHATRALPDTLLADVLDADQLRADETWTAAPLSTAARVAVSRASRGGSVQLLVTHSATASTALIDAIAAAVGIVVDFLSERELQQRRVRRLEAILAISAQWNQTFELEPLLEKMAEAATRLLSAERASVFLWDRPLKTLVGRPALGVPGGELRVPDDQGIVGRVLGTGTIARVDDDDASAAINRSVDKQLGFHTRNLLAVPLMGRQGERLGVFEVLNKRRGNFSTDDEAALVELAGHAAIALENSRQFSQLLQARNEMADQAAASVRLIGACPAMERLRETLRRIAATDLAVLITGENGTGKEVVAQLIHYLSARRREPLVALNCAALPESLLESELFGHEKGAFTDARETRLGKFEVASHGTLLLDEIGEMSLAGQAKLLRVLEDKMVLRVGGTVPIRTDARVIAATNQRLVDLVRQKKFREDLYFRLNVATLELPPLRERGSDVLLLAEHFLADFSRKARRVAPEWTDGARARLLEHAWPGNVRELRNLIERLVFLNPDARIEPDQITAHLSPLPTAPDAIPLSVPLAEATDRFQIEYIKKQIAAAGGNITEAAERLGMPRSNLYRKMRQLGMD